MRSPSIRPARSSFLLDCVKRLYSPETLDTRVLASDSGSSRPLGTSSYSRDSNKNELALEAQPSKWGTLEFRIYSVLFVIIVPWMFKQVIDVSKPSHPNYARFEPLLNKGWLFGRQLDNSDHQFSSFRKHLPYLLIVAFLHPLLRRFFSTVFYSGANEPRPVSTPEARLKFRTRFDFRFGLAFIAVLHGISALKILAILYINYEIGQHVPHRYIALATWAFGITVLFANELGKGYPLAHVAEFFLPWIGAGAVDRGVRVVNWGELLDRYQGLLSRWEILFKFTILRLISFNLDYYWSRNKIKDVEKSHNFELTEKERIQGPAQPQDYNFVNYVAYALYSPLYLAGPIITFNDYIAQSRIQPSSITLSRNVLYGIRFVLAYLSMEFFIHFLYVVAIFKARPDWSLYTPFQLSMLGFFNLIHIWLKLLLPWRLFRLWALTDGIDAPENMVRCVSNNYSALAFWRGWHRSYNRWVVRYIYIPLGGSHIGGLMGKARAAFNFLIVFTFVALWHDIQLRLLQWGWLISLFVLPEIVGKMMFPQPRYREDKETYRFLSGAGAVFNIVLMMVANLVGFAIGLDGIKDLIGAIVGSYSGIVFVISACVVLFIGAQIMFELREAEMRRGIRLSC